MPMCSDLLNGDFSGPDDAGVPFGWISMTIDGAVPGFRIDRPQDDDSQPVAAGWEVPEGAGSSDTLFYQRVPCEKDHRYRLSAETRLWNPWNNRHMTICSMVGIDPTGGTRPVAPSVIWCPPSFRRSEWVALSVSATAKSNQVTVFLRGYSQYSRLMNTRFRNVSLTDVTHE
jgi:hypothetical protein